MHRLLSTLAVFALLGAVQGQQIPRPAIDYPVKLSTGKLVKVSELKGKPAIVEFLLTTCPHCQHTAELLTKLQKEFGPKIQIIGVAMNDDADVPAFLKEHKVGFPVGTGPREPIYDFLQHSVMNPRINFPQLVFIDRRGTIQAQYSGEQPFFQDDVQEKNLRAQIQKLIGSAPAKAKS